MIQTVNESNFHDAFTITYDRKDNFSYYGRRALFEYLEELENDTGEQIELDVIALCCDYAEFDSATQCAEEYGIEGDTDYDEEEDEDGEAKEAYFLEALQEKTVVIEFNGGIIIQQF